MIRLYCDSGAYTKELGKLEQAGRISVHQFKYENRNRRILNGAIPSDLRYDDYIHYTYDQLKNIEVLNNLTFDQWRNSPTKYDQIVAIVGAENRKDAQHLDSAQLTGCTVFLTSDKQDIWAKRRQLLDLIGLHIFHVPSEWNDFLRYLDRIDSAVYQPNQVIKEVPRLPTQQAQPTLKRALNPIPAFVREALEAKKLTAAYEARPPYQRNDYLGWIARAKLPATQQKRLAQMLDELRQGDVYMKMAWRKGTRPS